jgi:hypothetical protein
MMRAALLVVLLAGGCSRPAPTIQVQTPEERAVSEMARRGFVAKQVYEVSFAGKGTDQDLQLLRDLPHLASVDLRQSKGITDAGLVHLQGLEEIRALNLEGTNVTDAGLVHLKGLPSLAHLTLTDTAITDKGLVQLEQMPKLKVVDIGETDVSRFGTAKLREARPDLEVTGSWRTEGHPEAIDEGGRLLKSWKANNVACALLKAAPERGYIANEKAWAKLWQAWRPKETLPKVDFEKQLIWVETELSTHELVLASYQLSARGNLRLEVSQLFDPDAQATEKTFTYVIGLIDGQGVKFINGVAVERE